MGLQPLSRIGLSDQLSEQPIIIGRFIKVRWPVSCGEPNRIGGLNRQGKKNCKG